MTYLDIVKNWLSLLSEHKDDIDKTTDDLLMLISMSLVKQMNLI